MYDTDQIVEEVDVADLDVVFISYDEPNCERNWSNTLNLIPWAKRVHRVKGFDAAHKAAAALARTSRLITIDGDTTVNPEFIEQRLRIPAGIRNYVFSWKSLNELNGLCYGNGSIKCWPRDAMLNMRTHEATDGDIGAVDFCWSVPFVGLRATYSTTYSASSAYQAFRSGIREGSKITLEHGQPMRPDQIINRTWSEAMHILRVWCSIGADHPHGLWAIYGARCGLRMMMDYPSEEYKKVSDYDWFVEQFRAHALSVGGLVNLNDLHADFRYDSDGLIEKIVAMGPYIYERSGIDLCLFDPQQSAYVKTLIGKPLRGIDPMVVG